MAVRVVLIVQLVIVALAGAAARGTNWTSSPGPPQAPNPWPSPSDDPPEWISAATGTVMVVMWFTFPLWGAIAAWRTRLAPWKIGASLFVGVFLWFALFVALLPAVQ